MSQINKINPIDELELLFTSKLNIDTLENTLENTLKTKIETITTNTSISKEYIKKLKTHLAFSKINHDKEILKETTIKHAHLYCVINVTICSACFLIKFSAEICFFSKSTSDL